MLALGILYLVAFLAIIMMSLLAVTLLF